MKRRKALGGILAFAGVGFASFSVKELFQINSKVERGQLVNYLNLIAELVDVMIPPSDTPGAKEAEVHYYIIDFMEACASNKEYANFFYGLKEIEENCWDDYKIPFEDCIAEQKIGIVKDLANSSFSNALLSKIDVKLRGRSFFTILKSLTVEGYCTSKQGAMELLVYQPVPGRYKAITTIPPDQKGWAVN